MFLYFSAFVSSPALLPSILRGLVIGSVIGVLLGKGIIALMDRRVPAPNIICLVCASCGGPATGSNRFQAPEGLRPYANV